jgi:hypothetical protein
MHKTTQKLGSVRAVTRLCGFHPGICLTTKEKVRKNLSQGRKENDIKHYSPISLSSLFFRLHPFLLHRAITALFPFQTAPSLSSAASSIS